MPEPRRGRHHRVFGVPSSTEEYEYQRNCFRRVCWRLHELFLKDTTGKISPYVIFTAVDEVTFDRDFGEGGRACDSFIPSLGIVLVEIITQRHELAHAELDTIIWGILHAMNRVDRELLNTGRASRKSSDREKRPDASYQPFDLPDGRSEKWPSFVIEAGWSETGSKLEKDVRWWFSASNGDVKGVITAAVHRNSRTIVLEFWHMIQSQLRSHRGREIPKVTQRIVISQETQYSSIRVSNEPLVIPFSELFLRSATTANGEQDIVIQREDLDTYGKKLWWTSE